MDEKDMIKKENIIKEKEGLINQLSEIRAELLGATIAYKQIQNSL